MRLYIRKGDVDSLGHLTVLEVVYEISKVKRTGLGKYVNNRHALV